MLVDGMALERAHVIAYAAGFFRAGNDSLELFLQDDRVAAGD